MILNGFMRCAAKILLPHKCKSIEPDKIKSILIFGQMGIGNMVLFTPFLRNLRTHFCKAHITVVFSRNNGSHQVLEGSGLCDEIIIISKKPDFGQFLELCKCLGNKKTDIAICRFNSVTRMIAFFLTLHRPMIRVGHISSGGWTGRFDFLFNYPVPMGMQQHETERYLGLAEVINVPIVDKRITFCIGQQEIDDAHKFIEERGIKNTDKLICVQMGSSDIQGWKRWPANKWVGLVDRLQQAGFSVILLGSQGERDYILGSMSKTKNPTVCAAGLLSLKQTAAVIRASRILLCNDSGLMHIAGGVGTPVLALFGPTDFSRTAPKGANSIVIRKDLSCSPCYSLDEPYAPELCIHKRCLGEIEIEAVFGSAMKLLERLESEKSPSITA